MKTLEHHPRPGLRARSRGPLGAALAGLLVCLSSGADTLGEGRGPSALVVASAPEGAMVFINDRFAGLTPLEVAGLAEGEYLLRIRKRGYGEQAMAVQVKGKNTSLTIRLDPIVQARLVVRSTPVSGEVSVDGRPRGEAPLELELPVGPHTLKVAAAGFLPWEKVIALKRGDETEVSAGLESRAETFLLGQISEEPWRLAYYYELAHHYLLNGEVGRAVETLGRGLRAAIDVRAPTSEATRLVQEIRNFHSGQFRFGDSQMRRELQPKLTELIETVAREQPRNVYAVEQLASRRKREGTLELYRAACEALKSDRAKRYFAHRAVSIARKTADRMLAGAERLAGQAKGEPPPKPVVPEKKQDDAQEPELEAEQKPRPQPEDPVRARYQETIDLLNKAVSEFQRTEASLSCLTLIAHIQRDRLKDTDAYLATLGRIVEEFPDHESCPVNIKTIASHLFLKGEHENAIKEYLRYLEVCGSPREGIETRTRIARCRLALKDKAGAARAYEEALKAYPKSDAIGSVLVSLIALHKEHGNEERRDHFRKILVEQYAHSPYAERYDLDPKRTADRREVGSLLKQIAQEAHELHSLKRKHRTLLADAERLRKAGKEPEAKSAEETAGEIQRQMDREARPLIKKYRDLAGRFQAYSEARTAQEQAIQLANLCTDGLEAAAEERRAYMRMFPEADKSVSYGMEIGHLYLKHEEPRKAIAAFREVIAQHPEREAAVEARARIIEILSHRRHEWGREEWVEEIERFLREHPRHSRGKAYLNQLAMIYYYQAFPGDLEKCRDAFSRLEKRFPLSSAAIGAERRRTMADDGMQMAESAIP